MLRRANHQRARVEFAASEMFRYHNMVVRGARGVQLKISTRSSYAGATPRAGLRRRVGVLRHVERLVPALHGRLPPLSPMNDHESATEQSRDRTRFFFLSLFYPVLRADATRRYGSADHDARVLPTPVARAVVVLLRAKPL